MLCHHKNDCSIRLRPGLSFSPERSWKDSFQIADATLVALAEFSMSWNLLDMESVHAMMHRDAVKSLDAQNTRYLSAPPLS